MTQEIGDNNLLDTWAATGSKVEPVIDKKNTGWASGERPAFQTMNWLQNTLAKQVNYLMQAGIPAHNSTTAYVIGSVVVKTGNTYIALADNTDSTPPSADWKLISVALPKTNEAASNPTASNDNTEGYAVFSKWLNTATGEVWVCTNASTGAAVWQQGTLDIDDLGSAAILNAMTAGQYAAAVNDAVLTAGAVWADNEKVALTDAATIAIDFSTGINFTVTLGGDRLIGNPSNAKVGQRGSITFTQDATGTRVPTFDDEWLKTEDIQFSTTPGAVDVLYYDTEDVDAFIVTGFSQDIYG